jgi:predicted N-acetyltransferase YhbS
MGHYDRPVPLSAEHHAERFDCGHSSLDTWLVERAMRNQTSGASRTFVIVAPGTSDIVGFYSLSATAVQLYDAPGRVRRNMPDPIPAILLGRLAVATSHHNQGLGRVLLRDAVQRVLHAADSVGIRALLVHAIDVHAAAFYRRFGFIAGPSDEQTFFLPIDAIKASTHG